MNPIEALAALRRLRENDDPEAAHSEADRILCELLTHLGCADIALAWEQVPKWYA